MDGMMTVTALVQHGCPWWELREVLGAPNLKWCEAPLCAWVEEPANTWSNLVYLVVALWCLWRASTRGQRILWHFGGSVALVGTLSFIYHATNTFGTQVLDFIGMYVLVFLLVTLNLHRMGLLPREKVAGVHLALTAGATLLIPVMRWLHVPYQLIVLMAVLLIVGTEVWLSRRAGAREQYRDFGRAVGLLAAAAACSVADVTRVWCEPDNHWLQGHALWHCLSALALLFAARHYAGLEARKGARVIATREKPGPVTTHRSEDKEHGNEGRTQ